MKKVLNFFIFLITLSIIVSCSQGDEIHEFDQSDKFSKMTKILLESHKFNLGVEDRIFNPDDYTEAELEELALEASEIYIEIRNDYEASGKDMSEFDRYFATELTDQMLDETTRLPGGSYVEGSGKCWKDYGNDLTDCSLSYTIALSYCLKPYGMSATCATQAFTQFGLCTWTAYRNFYGCIEDLK